MASPELNAVLELLRAGPQRDDMTAAEQRAFLDAGASATPVPEGTTLTEVDAGGVPAVWVDTPGASPERVVLYLHGGGYCIGSIHTHKGVADGIGRAAGARVLLVDYRLAPEHAHPAALDDALAAYRWLLARGPGSVAIAGDSAGGGLTVCTLLALRDSGDALPACGVALSPWLDLTGTASSWTTKADADPMCSPYGLGAYADWYLAGHDPKDPLVSPVFAPSLAGLPPVLVQVGSEEILLDDATTFAARAEADGTQVTLEVWDEMIHVFQAFAALLPEGRQAIDRIGTYLREHLA